MNTHLCVPANKASCEPLSSTLHVSNSRITIQCGIKVAASTWFFRHCLQQAGCLYIREKPHSPGVLAVLFNTFQDALLEPSISKPSTVIIIVEVLPGYRPTQH